METNVFHTLINIYHERSFKQWTLITACTFSILFLLLGCTSIHLMRTYLSKKREYYSLEHEVAALQQTWIAHRPLFKKQKQLKKQLQLFKQRTLSPTLITISSTIPLSTFLTSLTIDDSVVLRGLTPDLHELSHFAAQLSKKGLNVAIKETKPQGTVFHFEITIEST